MEEDVRKVREYYDRNAESEYARIENRPEFLLTMRFMKRHIRPGESVLDIGGGPGRYTLALAEMGCRVTLIDLSEGNVRLAREKAEKKRLSIRAMAGDAREADRLVDGPYDHVLLMGPLYHLLNETDRVRCVETALRLLKPGGLLWAAFLCMGSQLIYLMTQGPEEILSENPADREWLARMKRGEDYAGDAFTRAYFAQTDHVRSFMDGFGLEKVLCFAQEGILSPQEAWIMKQPTSVVNAWLDVSEAVCQREDMLGWGEHLMYVGRKRA